MSPVESSIVIGQIFEFAQVMSWRASVSQQRSNTSRGVMGPGTPDRKSTRLNSSHVAISYAVFCLKKKNKQNVISTTTQDNGLVPDLLLNNAAACRFR